jgi:hypothetical protein
MRDEDVVLGLTLEGDSRAYPWWIMDDHHVANDIVGGRPVAILLCEMCSTGVAFDPVVKGRRLTFGQRHTFNGTITLDDHETGSVWSPYLAMAIRGPLRGTRLDLLPVAHSEWGAWCQAHPETTVLPPELGSRTGHGSKHTIGTPLVGPSFRRRVRAWDTRLPHSTLVLGVLASGGQRAYPLDRVRAAGGVVNDDIGGEPMVVLADLTKGSYAALAFSPLVGRTRLEFRPGPGGAVDERTGSRWTFEGRAVEGPLAGSQLRFVPSHVSEWFIWAAHFDGLQIGGSESAPEGTAEPLTAATPD